MIVIHLKRKMIICIYNTNNTMNSSLINIVIEYCYYGRELMNELVDYYNLKCDTIVYNSNSIEKCDLEAKYTCKHCNSRFCEQHKSLIYSCKNCPEKHGCIRCDPPVGSYRNIRAFIIKLWEPKVCVKCSNIPSCEDLKHCRKHYYDYYSDKWLKNEFKRKDI